MKRKIFRLDKLMITAVFAVTVIALYVFDVPCVVQSVIGAPCPGCGMTRAWLSALRLDLAAAFEYHSLFWSLPVLFVFFWFDGKVFKRQWLNCLIMSAIALAFVFRWIIILLF